MSEKDFKRLEGIMEGLSKQMRSLQSAVIGVTSQEVERLEEGRREAEKTEKKHEILLYYRSLLMGLILGVFGNIFVSYLMKALDIFQISSEGWLLATFAAIVGVLALIWVISKNIKKLLEEIPSS